MLHIDCAMGKPNSNSKSANTENSRVENKVEKITKILRVALGFFVFSKGNSPKVETFPPLTTAERKAAKPAVLLLESSKGSSAADVFITKDGRLALSKCRANGLGFLMDGTRVDALPSFKVSGNGVTVLAPGIFDKAPVVSYKRNGHDVTGRALGYDASRNLPEYQAVRHECGKAVWHGAIESKKNSKNAHELCKSVVAVKATPARKAKAKK